jgi:putative aminopeptidase FrvX
LWKIPTKNKENPEMIDLIPILKDLCEAFGPSGYEEEVRAVIRRHVTPLVDEVKEDVLGNLIAWKKSPNARGTVLLDGHIDEIGFIVTHIDTAGFLRFAPLGGWDPRVIPSHRALVRAANGDKIQGVIGVLPPHVTAPADREKAFQIENLFIDVGCTTAEQARALGIEIGSPAVIHYPFMELANGCVATRALDDRVACALIIGLFHLIKDKKLPVNVVGSFSAQEEVSAAGAKVASYTVKPDVALALEGTTATDTPDVPPQKQITALRKGPAITIADARTIVPQKVVRFLVDQAKQAGIPYQLKIPRVGGTDAGVIQVTGSGVLTGILSVPCRYIHSPTSVLHRDDLHNTLRLVEKFVENAADGLLG